MVRVGVKIRLHPLDRKLNKILIVNDHLFAIAFTVVPRPTVFGKVVSIAGSVPDMLDAHGV